MGLPSGKNPVRPSAPFSGGALTDCAPDLPPPPFRGGGRGGALSAGRQCAPVRLSRGAHWHLGGFRMILGPETQMRGLSHEMSGLSRGQSGVKGLRMRSLIRPWSSMSDRKYPVRPSAPQCAFFGGRTGTRGDQGVCFCAQCAPVRLFSGAH